MRSLNTHARQWAFSAMPLVTLGGLLLGLSLSLGGAVALCVAKGGLCQASSDASFKSSYA